MKLQAELHGEQALNKALHWALHGPLLSHPHVASTLPPQVSLVFSALVSFCMDGFFSRIQMNFTIRAMVFSFFFFLLAFC